MRDRDIHPGIEFKFPPSSGRNFIEADLDWVKEKLLERKEKDIVVPGEALAEGMDYLPGSGTYRLDDKIIAKKLGLVNISGRAIKLVSLSGRYLPKYGDKIICKVTDITISGWIMDINSAYSAFKHAGCFDQIY